MSLMRFVRWVDDDTSCVSDCLLHNICIFNGIHSSVIVTCNIVYMTNIAIKTPSVCIRTLKYRRLNYSEHFTIHPSRGGFRNGRLPRAASPRGWHGVPGKNVMLFFDG